MDNLPDNISIIIKNLLTDIINSFKHTLGNDLVGVYIHGSLAMGSFNPDVSDIDLLVVVKEKLTVRTKKEIIKFLITYSDKATKKGLEISILTLDQVRNFEYPTPFELHYSNTWKDVYLSGKVDYEKQKYDPDLAGHFIITLHRGICLYGEPIKNIFSEIPEKYYIKSILNDAEDIYTNITKDPVYGILNLCRVLAYLKEKKITSKAEGGIWGLQHIDRKYHSLIKKALDVYQGKELSSISWDKQQLEEFAKYMKDLSVLFDKA